MVSFSARPASTKSRSIDATDTFVDILRREAKRLADHRADFVSSFSESDLNYLVDRWAMKDRFCQAGDMKWGIYLGTKHA